MDPSESRPGEDRQQDALGPVPGADAGRIPPRPPLPPQPAAPTEPIDTAPPAPVAEPEATTLPLPIVTPEQAYPQAPYPQPYPPTAQGAPPPPAAPKRRRRGRAAIWTVGVIVVLAVLAVAGWFAGEAWAKSTVVAAVQQKTIAALGLPATQEVDVTLAQPVLPQLVSGSLSTLTVKVPDAPIAGGTGTLTVHATGVPVRGGGAPATMDAAVSLSPAVLQKLAGAQSDIVPGSLHIVGSDVAVSLNPAQFLSGVSFTLTLHPSAASGQLVLTPTTFEVAGYQMQAETVRERFGSLAPGILGPRAFCVASSFPKGMTLTAITVSPTAVVTAFRVDPSIVSDAALQAKGTCG